MVKIKTATLELVIFIVKVLYTLESILKLLVSVMVSTQKLWVAEEPFDSFKSQFLSLVSVLDIEVQGNFMEVRLYLIDILLIDALEIGFCEQFTDLFIVSGEIMQGVRKIFSCILIRIDDTFQNFFERKEFSITFVKYYLQIITTLTKHKHNCAQYRFKVALSIDLELSCTFLALQRTLFSKNKVTEFLDHLQFSEGLDACFVGFSILFLLVIALVIYFLITVYHHSIEHLQVRVNITDSFGRFTIREWLYKLFQELQTN